MVTGIGVTVTCSLNLAWTSEFSVLQQDANLLLYPPDSVFTLITMVIQLLIMSAVLGASCFAVGTVPLSYTFSSKWHVIF